MCIHRRLRARCISKWLLNYHNYSTRQECVENRLWYSRWYVTSVHIYIALLIVAIFHWNYLRFISANRVVIDDARKYVIRSWGSFNNTSPETMKITVGHAIKSFNSRSNSLREQCHFRNRELGFCGHRSKRDLTSQLYRDWALFRFSLLNLIVHKAISDIPQKICLSPVCIALIQNTFLSHLYAKSLTERWFPFYRSFMVFIVFNVVQF